MGFIPSYSALYKNGKLAAVAEELEARMQDCSLCPRSCSVDRRTGRGSCGSGLLPVVSSAGPHFGEERCLVGRGGAGTIFFTHCNMACVFCQNYDISQLGQGREIGYGELASMMLSLQAAGCHNINFVTPTHMVYAIVRALIIAAGRGLSVPLVYNSGGYDSVDTLKLLEGVFDIYMPDFKYWDVDTARRFSGVEHYPETARAALREMHGQVGDLQIDSTGIARRGLLVRHLVLPGNLAGTTDIIDFVRGLSSRTFLNIMDQYRPAFRADTYNELKRRPTLEEVDEAIRYARGSGLTRLG